MKAIGLRIIGVIGEIMITLGVLLMLFLVWQLWWTDVVADREQAAVVAALGWEDAPAISAPSAHRTDAPPVDAAPTKVGEVFATLYVPRFGKDYVKPIANGVDKYQVLDRLGVGHYPQTQMPGELGNFAIAGHRTTYGKPFTHIEKLVKGDVVIVRTEKTWYVYTVTGHVIVQPNAIGVLSPVPTEGTEIVTPTEKLTGRYLTMTSCHPRYYALQRWVTHGELKYWMPVSAGTPDELLTTKKGS